MDGGAMRRGAGCQRRHWNLRRSPLLEARFGPSDSPLAETTPRRELFIEAGVKSLEGPPAAQIPDVANRKAGISFGRVRPPGVVFRPGYFPGRPRARKRRGGRRLINSLQRLRGIAQAASRSEKPEASHRMGTIIDPSLGTQVGRDDGEGADAIFFVASTCSKGVRGRSRGRSARRKRWGLPDARQASLRKFRRHAGVALVFC